MRAPGCEQQSKSAPDELRPQVARSRQSVYRTEALFRPRDHRGTKATGCHRATRGLDRFKYLAQPRPRGRQDSYRAEWSNSPEGSRTRRMAKDAFSQKQVTGDTRLVARRHEMR